MTDTITPDNYLTTTPFGMVNALFGEAPGCELRGPADAVAHIKRVMVGCTNADGMSMSVETVEPADYFNFCQPEGSGMRIIEPVDVTLDPLAGWNAERLDEVGGMGRTPPPANKGPVNVFKAGDKVVSLDTDADLVVTRQDGFRVYVKGRADWLHANRLRLASGKAPERRVMDDCGEDEDGEEFDAEAEFDACEPAEDDDEAAK